MLSRVLRAEFVHLLKREVYLLRLLLQIGRQWARDKCPQQAASLAFQTSLSLVPMTAVGFALLRATGALEERSALLNWLSRMLPYSGERIVDRLLGFADNIRPGALGLPGILFTLLLLYVLFDNIEKIWNDIWRARQRRAFFGKFPVFYTLVTLGPAAIGAALYYTVRFWGHGAGTMASLGITALFLLLANRLLPRVHVRWRAAALAALISTVLLEVGKFAFSVYVSRVLLSRYEGIYGPYGVIPILLIWIYYAWLAVLFGAEVGYTVQNLEQLTLEDAQ
jgi:membrane protein